MEPALLTGSTRIQVWSSCVAFCPSPSVLCQHSEGQSVLSLCVTVHCSLGVWTPCVFSSSKNPQLPKIHLSSGLAQQPLVSWGRLWGLEVCPSMSHARNRD